MTGLRFRIAAQGEDWPAIRRLLAAAFAHMDGRIDPPSSLRRMSAETLAAHDGPKFLASRDGRVVGCAFGRADGDALLLSKIAVDPGARGAGVARTLVDLAAWEGARRGLARLRLQSRAELTETHAAFRALGFAKTGETAHPGFDRPTSITMEREIGAPPAPPFLSDGGEDELRKVIRACPPLMAALRAARGMALPDWWIVSGALYNQVWNARTGRPDLYGVKDIDLFYFDPDTSWEAEDATIRRAAGLFAAAPPVEIRNQARVPLWYRDRFGHDYPPLSSSAEAIDRFACRAHCVGVRLEADDGLTVHAPYGLSDIFGLRLAPNLALPNRATHEAKAARQAALWPELTVAPWPEEET